MVLNRRKCVLASLTLSLSCVRPYLLLHWLKITANRYFFRMCYSAILSPVNWFPGSSAVTGISSAEWCLASVRGENLCRGKWGHGMEPVPASYQRYEMVYDKLQLQWVPLAFAGANRFTEENALLLFGGSTSDSLINDVFKSKEGCT